MNLASDFFFKPANDPTTFIVIGIFLAVLAVAYLVYYFFFKKQSFRKEMWLRLMRHAYKKQLTEKEVNALKTFYMTLNSEEISDILFQREHFKNRLFNFFTHNHEHQLTTEVHIYDKLFPEPGNNHEIVGPKSLHSGEACGIEVDGKQLFGQVIRFNDTQILISVVLEKSDAHIINQDAKLYFYRPNLAGYYLHGKIENANLKGLIFRYNGKINRVLEHHIMSDLAIDFKLTLTDLQDLHSQMQPLSSAEASVKEKNPDNTPEKERMEILGVSVKISDRAMLCKLRNLPSSKYISPSYIFQMQMELPDGFTISSHCRIQYSEQKGLFLVKFLDMQNSHKDILVAEIRKNEPTREHLG